MAGSSKSTFTDGYGGSEDGYLPPESRANKLLRQGTYILVDDPLPFVRRITLNRPDKRNAMNHAVRMQIFDALHRADADPSVRVTIIRGAGKGFCAGYDLEFVPGSLPMPSYDAGGDGQFQRNVVHGWFNMWDLKKPVIAQVHGWCLAGGCELASAADLVYVADDAKIGYPPVRSMGLPDAQVFPWLCGLRGAMELMLTGDAVSGPEAVRLGWANRSFPLADLEDRVLKIAQRVAKVPEDLSSMNKRSVHRAMEVMGMRTALRYGTDLQALSMHSPTSRKVMAQFTGQKGSVAKVVGERDKAFGDGRNAKL
eukprot:TRINITY_DN8684_c0_g1_i1.p1 TRINITY_DN8684_c0_g1~~TRINITY_DN8684_c0_g1_i1.p1  ORF type:complete len:311 (+),score=91.52 TRINITY_DN8684_c0_g1_i1:70-1002(+)